MVGATRIHVEIEERTEGMFYKPGVMHMKAAYVFIDEAGRDIRQMETEGNVYTH